MPKYKPTTEDVEHQNELEAISMLERKGHTHYCACRQVWGDGECECYYDENDEYWERYLFDEAEDG